MITIEHSHAEGTLVHGTGRGDGTNPVIKATGDGWKFSRNIGDDGAWYLPRSRDRHPDTGKIERLASGLRAAGYQVEVHVDDTPRGSAEIEADRGERVTGRVARYEQLAHARHASGGARLEDVRQARERIPLGQPILSTRDANYRDKLHRREETARAELAAGDHWQHRAEAADSSQRYRHNPRVTLRRLDRLEAEQRAWQRRLDEVRSGGTYGEYADDGRYADQAAAYITRAEQAIAHLGEQISFWREQLATLQATGAWASWRPEHFRVGDEAMVLGSWYPVLRVNKKSLTISPLIFGEQRRLDKNGKDAWTDTIRYDKVYGRRRDGNPLHHPPPAAEATCTEPTPIDAATDESTAGADADTCPRAPAARLTIHHDGTACGCHGRCLLDPSDGTRLEPWTEVRLWCDHHLHQYQTANDGDPHQPPARTLEHLDPGRNHQQHTATRTPEETTR